MPQMMLISVVLPAPFGPSSAKISPRSIARFTPLRACKPPAYDLVSPSTKTMGALVSGIGDAAHQRLGELRGVRLAPEITGPDVVDVQRPVNCGAQPRRQLGQ